MSLLSFIKRLVGQDDALLQAESRFSAELGKLASERAALANSGKDLQSILSTLESQRCSIQKSTILSGVSIPESASSSENPFYPEAPPTSKGR